MKTHLLELKCVFFFLFFIRLEQKSNLLDWRGEDHVSLLNSWLEELLCFSENDLQAIQVGY